MLADNKLTDRSSWDERKVAIVLKELSDIVLDFEIEATGFEPPEIDLRIQSLDSPDESRDAADEFEAPDDPPISRSGDLWTLGDHRLLCGSALEPQCVWGASRGRKGCRRFYRSSLQCPGQRPCGRQRREETSRISYGRRRMTEDEFCGFLREAFELIASHSVDGATLFACMDWRHFSRSLGAIRALGCDLLNLCVWVKTNGGMGSLYRSRHELVFVFGKAGRNAGQQRPARQTWAQPNKRLELSGHELLCAARPHTRSRPSSHRQTHRDGQRRDPRRHATR